MGRKIDIVVTTIFEPSWLPGYLDNLRAHAREKDVTIRIICDRKTPARVFAAARRAASDGFIVDCPSLEEQSRYLAALALPGDFIPWDSDNRRNIGFLRAWENGTDLLISIDDDNYCRGDSDFVGDHEVVGSRLGQLKEGTRWAGNAPWHNVCRQLRAQVTDPFYPRGYPYAARKLEAQATLTAVPVKAANALLAVNAGLWLDDPDVDAVSRLAQSPRVSAAEPQAVVLGPDTWSPINTQNTALIRGAIPAYYYVRMGYPIQGMRIDRYGDILSGYFLQKCAKHLGDAIRFGDPLADHRRTPHNLFKDLYHELAGMVLVEDLLPWLQELKLSGSDYPAVYGSLASALSEQADRFSGFVWDQGGREFLHDTARCMQQWLRTLEAMH